MLKPVCVKCARFFRPMKTGFCFTEGSPRPGTGSPAKGNTDPDSWQPYKVWSGDMWECQGCGARIISGTGMEPLAERHHANFEKIVSYTGLQVNDC